MDPVFLGRIQCFDVDKQCVIGEDTTNRLTKNDKLSNAFNQACREKKGSEIRCCPLDLINRPYNPPQDGSVIPIHVKFKHGQFSACPESIRSECSREDDLNRGLCVAQKCSDAGYLEAENYYQICKSFREKGEMQTIPDCSKKTCNKTLALPPWYAEEAANTDAGISGNGVGTLTESQPAPVQDIAPQRQSALEVPPPTREAKKDYGFTIQNFFNMLPVDQNFYKWAAIVLGILALVIIFANMFIFTTKASRSAAKLASNATGGISDVLSGFPDFSF